MYLLIIAEEKYINYHPNIVFTVKENPGHLLHTACTYDNQFDYNLRVKLPTHGRSEIPAKWKRNCIIGVLYKAKRISPDFN